MTMPKRVASVALLALPLLTLLGCATQGTRYGASPAQAAACRSRTEEVYLTQNRGEVYRADAYAGSTRDAPFGAGIAAQPSTGLSQRYARAQIMDDCLRSEAGNVGTPQAAPPVIK